MPEVVYVVRGKVEKDAFEYIKKGDAVWLGWTEIEDFIEGFNQPTYRGMRINGQRVATWSSQHGWSGDGRQRPSGSNNLTSSTVSAVAGLFGWPIRDGCLWPPSYFHNSRRKIDAIQLVPVRNARRL